MRAEIKLITPAFAKELLKMNVGNRRLKAIKNAYIGQMLNGEWKENGEAIIIDINGFIKDGQHRLNACIEANHSWNCPIIYDVDPNVMDTIDTGTNRNLSDILQLNGFTYYTDISSLVKGILSYENGNSIIQEGGGGQRQSKTSYVSNNRGLSYAEKNKDYLLRLAKVSDRIYKNQTIKVLSRKEVGVLLYMIGGSDFNAVHVEFFKKISGVTIDENSATSWLYKKLLSSKVNKATLKNNWKIAAVVRTWNVFSNGDYPVKNLRIDVTKKEEINKI